MYFRFFSVPMNDTASDDGSPQDERKALVEIHRILNNVNEYDNINRPYSKNATKEEQEQATGACNVCPSVCRSHKCWSGLPVRLSARANPSCFCFTIEIFPKIDVLRVGDVTLDNVFCLIQLT